MSATPQDVQAKLATAKASLAAASASIDAASVEAGQLVAPPTPPPPPPPPSSGAWAWDATKATVKSNSAAIVAAFVKYGGPFAYFAAEVGVGAVTAHDTTTAYKVLSAGKAGGPWDTEIWFPNGVAPGVATDGHLAIADVSDPDPAKHRWHDFEMYRGQGWVNGRVTGWTGGDSMAAGAVQEPPGGGAHGGATVARFPLLRGLVTLDDVKSGSIDHALVYTMTNCGPTPNPYPSSQLASYTSPNVTMPTDQWQLMPSPGTWLAVDPSLDISALAGFERMVMRALQQYGMFCRDRSTDFALHGADVGGGGASFGAWNSLGVPINTNGSLKFSASFVDLIKHLRVLQAPTP